MKANTGTRSIMESMPDHVLLAIFRPSLVRDRMLSLQLVCQRWRNLAFYNLAKDFGPRLETGFFEKMSIVGVRNRNDGEGRMVESSDFLLKLLRFILELSEADCFKCVKFSVSRDTPGYPEWCIDEGTMELILAHCPNMEKFDFDYAQVEQEAFAKLLQFKNLKHLAIKRVDASFAFVLELLQLESLKISGKQAPLTNLVCNSLRKLTVEAPAPSSYFDLLTTLTISAPGLERLVRKAGGEREPLPGDVISQIRSHTSLKTFSDRMFYLSDDNALTQLVDAKQTQFESLRVYSEDCLRLSVLGQMEKLRKVAIDGKNLEPDELASVFFLTTLERLSLSWTFKDDRNGVLESELSSAQKMMDIRCAGLKSIFLHLDYISASGRAWGKNVIVNVLQQCPRLKRMKNSDWLFAPDYVELRDTERFVDVSEKVDVNVTSAMDLFQMLNVLSPHDEEFLAADPFCWRRLTHLSVFINEDYYVCDLSCVSGLTLPNLRKFKIRSDNDVFFERFCEMATLEHLTRIEGVVRFENSDAELDWLDHLGEHRKFIRLSTIQSTLTPSLFCDVLMRARARMRESGYEAPATVVYVSTGASRRLRPTESDRIKWAEVAKILYTSRIMLRLLCA